jgi:hypothetical protein
MGGRGSSCSFETRPAEHYQDHAKDGSHGREGEVEAPPVDGSWDEQNERQDSPRPVSAPQQPAGNCLEKADQEESQQKGDGRGKPLALERAASVGWKAQDGRDAAPGGEVAYGQDTGHAQAYG